MSRFLLLACMLLGAGGCTHSVVPLSDATSSDPATDESRYLASLGADPDYLSSIEPALNKGAEEYVRLALALGEHDKDYVDAYHGPAEWREQERSARRTLQEIHDGADALATLLHPDSRIAGPHQPRAIHLVRQLEALAFRAAMLAGEQFTFDEESQGLYDAVAPQFGVDYFESILAELDGQLPGEGSVAERRLAYRSRFEIPPELLDRVFRTAIEECRRRARQFVELPDNERFRIEYVNDKSWSGYNWFQGDANSLIQVNTDFPIYIDRAVDLACHEGYPGHHVYNTLLEKNLVRDRGWVEFTVFPLFSPTGLIAEGSANYGIEMAFPGEERVEFESSVLFPLAGLAAESAAGYYAVEALVNKLAYAGNEAARQYLNGEIDAAEAADWLARYALMAPDRAAQRVRFIDQYRSYVINYNLGRDLVARFVEAAGPDPAARRARFVRLLSEPFLPSQLK